MYMSISLAKMKIAKKRSTVTGLFKWFRIFRRNIIITYSYKLPVIKMYWNFN